MGMQVADVETENKHYLITIILHVEVQTGYIQVIMNCCCHLI